MTEWLKMKLNELMHIMQLALNTQQTFNMLLFLSMVILDLSGVTPVSHIIWGRGLSTQEKGLYFFTLTMSLQSLLFLNPVFLFSFSSADSPEKGGRAEVS